MTTLENSYCVPTKEQWAQIQKIEPKGYINFMGAFKKGNVIMVEWDHIDVGNMILSNKKSDVHDRKEIPVQHFIDLVEDRISGWRLEEVGFVNHSTQYIGLFGSSHIHYTISNGHIRVTPFDGIKGINAYITTFTELLTLIKFLTPPTK